MNYGDVATTVGDGLAALAIMLAGAQLRSAARAAQQTRLDLREDRRLDFYLGQLVELALAVQKGLNVAFAGLQIRTALQMLPNDLLPLLRAFMGVDASAAGIERMKELQQANPVPSGLRFSEHYQSELQAEILEAREHLLQLRPERRTPAAWWQLWRV